MPAEWELHEATWMTWPHNPETWPGYSLEEVETVYLEMIRPLVEAEHVHLLVNDESMEQRARRMIEENQIPLDKVSFHTIPTNDSWIRDYGPNFISRETESGGNEVAANVWQFDSWGGKYPADLDGRAAGKIAEKMKFRHFLPAIVLEGGAIDVNGRGTCLTTEQCLLNENRNGGKTWQEMETLLQDYLGVRQVIWCKGELEGDDTDGHIDNLARFVNSRTVLCVWDEDTTDPNHACMKENLEILGSAQDQEGRPLEVVKLPTPGKVVKDGQRLPASYANFYIGNAAVLVPVFDHPNDALACDILSRFFPDRRVVPIPGKVLATGLGGPHCLTQQQPIQFDF